MQSDTLTRYRVDALYNHKRRAPPSGGGKRGRIRSDTPSSTSLRNLVFLLNNCDQQMTHMLTLTFGDELHDQLSPEPIKRMLNKLHQRLRYLGYSRVTVREFTKRERVHFHIFLSGVEDVPTAPDGFMYHESLEWSAYWSKLAEREFTADQNAFDKMSRVCGRFERLRSSAAGRYCSKEGGKRFQKKAPAGWEGIAWWSKSRDVTCSAIQVEEVTLEISDEIQTCEVEIPCHDQWGTTVRKSRIPYKHQFGLGVSRDSKATRKRGRGLEKSREV